MRTSLRFFFSTFLIGLALCGFAADWARITGALERAKSSDEFKTIITAYQSSWTEDPQVQKEVQGIIGSNDEKGWSSKRDNLVEYLRAKVLLEGTRAGKLSDPQVKAVEILKNPAFRDNGSVESKNWLTGIFENMLAWLAELIQNLLGRVNLGKPAVGGIPIGGLAYLVWGIIVIAIVALLTWAAINFGWGKMARRKPKAGGLLDDEEPDRTADEWLVRADALEAEGRFREAVRCLYLACLVRLDETKVARFNRNETNWEHLRRISASPTKPPGLDFRPATSEFDTIWYGFQTRGGPDVATFRQIYRSLCQELKIDVA